MDSQIVKMMNAYEDERALIRGPRDEHKLVSAI